MKLPEGHRLLHLASVDSTNEEARRRATRGERGPLWILADEQTAGRGRLGRLWQSPAGNLHATFLSTHDASAEVASEVGFVAALAVHDAVVKLCPELMPRLKWPNDVLVGGAKLCGILSETLHSKPLVVALGFGINLAKQPSGLSYAVAALGSRISPQIMLENLAEALARRQAEWSGGRGFAAVRSAWCARSFEPGTRMTVDGRSGSFAGLDPAGALLLDEGGGSIATFHAGDVRLAEERQ